MSEKIAPTVDIYDISGGEPVLGTIAPEEVEQAISSGKYSFPKEMRVPVVSPDGQMGDIDPSEAPKAFSSGYKYATPELKDESNYGSGTQTAIAAAEGAAQGLAGPLATLAEKGLGVPEEDILGRSKANPIAHGLGELGGFTAGMMAGTGEAAVLSKIGEAAALGFNTTTRLGTGILKGAVETMVMAGGDEISKAILHDPGQSVGSVVADVGLAGVLGGVVGSVHPLWKGLREGPVESILNMVKSDSEHVASRLTVEPGQEQVSPTLKRILSTFGGVAPKDIEAYVANADAIKAAPGYDDVYSHALGYIQKVAEDLESKKIGLSEAKAGYKGLVDEVTQSFKEMGFDASLANQSAKQALKEAQQQLVSEIQQTAVSKAAPIANAIDILNTGAIADSRAAKELLSKTEKQVSLEPFYTKIKELQDKVFSHGSPLALQQAENLGKYAETIGSQYGTKTDATFVKSIIEGLDTMSKWSSEQLSGSLAPYYRQIRHTLDASLKEQIPGYAKAIKPAADKFQLLEKLSKYSTPEDAVKGILSLKSPANFINEMPLLRELEQSIGIKFTQDLDPYASKAIRELKISALPEYAAAEKATKAMEYYKHPASLETLIQSLNEEHGAVTEAEKALQGAQSVKENLGPISEASLQSKLNTTISGKSIANREILNKFPGLKGMSIPEILDLIHIRQAFEKGSMHGSRNVNLFGSMGASAGAIAGGWIGAAAGGAGGATIGAIVDKEGPALVRKFLDRYVSHYGDLLEHSGASSKDVKRALLNTLGQDVPPNAEGFKASVGYIRNVEKGVELMKNAAKGVFTGGAAILPQNIVPSKEDTDKLDEKLKSLNIDQSGLLNVSGSIGHYLPNHAVSVANMAMNAVNMAAEIRPNNPKASPLDTEIPLSQQQKSEWNRTLQVMQQPLVAFKHIKDGSLLPKDVALIKQLYPETYAQMSQELNTAMIESLSDGKAVPYKVRQSLSMFLGQPMDSTFLQPVMLAAQMPFMMKPKPEMPAPQKSKGKLGNLAKSSATTLQAREEHSKKA